MKRRNAPLLSHVRALAWRAYRCRIVNRAFGTNLTPDHIATAVPDEDIDLLIALDDHEQLNDPLALLRLLLKRHA